MILRAFIFLLAMAAAGGAAWLTMQAGSESKAATVEVRTQAVPTVDVLVAAGDIAGGNVLSPDKLRWEPWPEPNVSDRFITRGERPEAPTELAGTFVDAGFADGEPIREARLTAANENLLSARIEPGKLAAAVPVTAESAAGGFILPGDRVDVIQTVTISGTGEAASNSSRIIISNVRVLAIDQTDAQTPEGTVVGKTATLELTPGEAEHIMAAGASGRLSLALRSVADHVNRSVTTGDPVQSVLVRRGSERSTVTIR
jgi:pilus assembly protein CpaB